MASKKLTPKREKFCVDIASGKFDFDYQAYEAHFSTANMSKNSIYTETFKLMQVPEVALKIKELREEAVERNQVKVDEVLRELANWLRFDPLDIIDPETEALKPLKEMSKASRMSLGEIHVQELFEMLPNESGNGKSKTKVGELKKIKFYDKTKVADMFLRKFGEYIAESNDLVSNIDAMKELINELRK